MKRVRDWFLLVCVIAFGAILASCGDHSATGPGADPASLQPAASHNGPPNKPPGRKVSRQAQKLVHCRPQHRDWTLKRIGPDGGVVEVGPYRLTIPRGALERRVVIGASIPGRTGINIVQFGPDGLTFRVPATLTMTYENCERNPEHGRGHGSEEDASLRVAVVDDALNVLYYLPSVDRKREKTVTATVEHFTNYAIAY